MTSRLTATALCFAVLATASLAFATDFRGDATAMNSVTTQSQVVRLERVVVTAKRSTVVSR